MTNNLGNMNLGAQQPAQTDFFNTSSPMHPPAQPGDMVLVDKTSVWGDKLRKELGVLVIWLRGTARGKSSWTQDASRRCWTVRVLHGDRHVCFRGCLDRVLQLVL